MLDHFGIDAKVLAGLNYFKPESSKGKILLFDGDAACYTSTAGVANIKTAINKFEKAIYTAMFLAGCEKARVHLTPRGCYKNGRRELLTVKPYQDNRGSAKKPPLLEVLRSGQAVHHFVNHPDIEVFLHFDIEADDALMMDAYTIQNGILASADKDLNIVPTAKLDLETGLIHSLPIGDRYGWIDRKFWNTDAGNVSSKMIGQGTKFFWAQMLMGDTADNVQGIIKLNGKLCGEAGAYAALEPIKTESECANFVLDGYRKIDQNPIPEGVAMWLIRNYEDSFYDYALECKLSSDNIEFLNDCFHNRVWRKEIDDDVQTPD